MEFDLGSSVIKLVLLYLEVEPFFTADKELIANSQ